MAYHIKGCHQQDCFKIWILPTYMGICWPLKSYLSGAPASGLPENIGDIAILCKGLRLTAGRRPSNDVWRMVWEDWAEILRANPGRAMWRTEAGIMRSACLYGSSLGLCWTQVVPMLGQVGPMLSHVGPILGLYWPRLGPCWALLGAMLGPCLGHLCWNDLKMPFFPPRAPSWSPKPRKKQRFFNMAKMKSLAAEGPEPP